MRCLSTTKILSGSTNNNGLRIPLHKYTDGPAVGGSKCAAAGSKVAGAPLGSCRFVSMDAMAKPSFCYGSRLCLTARDLQAFGSSCHTVGDSKLTRRGTTHLRTSLGGAPQKQKMLKGHLPRVIHHQVYKYTKKQLACKAHCTARKYFCQSQSSMEAVNL
jgi:hypothetical protein